MFVCKQLSMTMVETQYYLAPGDRHGDLKGIIVKSRSDPEIRDLTGFQHVTDQNNGKV